MFFSLLAGLNHRSFRLTSVAGRRGNEWSGQEGAWVRRAMSGAAAMASLTIALFANRVVPAAAAAAPGPTPEERLRKPAQLGQ